MDMDRSARGWLYNTARQHYWRVASWYEFEDLVQDGFMHWARVCQRYPHLSSRLQHARHRRNLMSLFQRTYMNHLNDLANERRRAPEVVPLDTIADREACEFAELMQCCQEAPWPMNKVLAILLSDAGAQKLSAAYRVRRDGTRETFNERLCRIAGLDPSPLDLPTQLKNYLQSV